MTMPFSNEQIEDLKNRKKVRKIYNLGGLIPLDGKGKAHPFIHFEIKELHREISPEGDIMILGFPSMMIPDDKLFGSKDEFWMEKPLYYLVQRGCLKEVPAGILDSFYSIAFAMTPETAGTNTNFDESAIMTFLNESNKLLREIITADKIDQDSLGYTTKVTKIALARMKGGVSEYISQDKAIEEMKKKDVSGKKKDGEKREEN